MSFSRNCKKLGHFYKSALTSGSKNVQFSTVSDCETYHLIIQNHQNLSSLVKLLKIVSLRHNIALDIFEMEQERGQNKRDYKRDGIRKKHR